MFKPFNRDDKKKKLKDPLKKKKVYKKRPCRFCMDKVERIDYLDYNKFHELLTLPG